MMNLFRRIRRLNKNPPLPLPLPSLPKPQPSPLSLPPPPPPTQKLNPSDWLRRAQIFDSNIHTFGERSGAQGMERGNVEYVFTRADGEVEERIREGIEEGGGWGGAGVGCK
ncbi:hypothetical protein SBOR_0008 [Sclerotinia borealis F-4128]|uniref:Uncharacterized protein n=1 Tax=Sclerotinia borealis (strain F-4128) TaxID=1432307 RepID=W9CS16_SCLBF|nr:hypothetical protein SBOR_0008 [Sclerotinia borealis F-4128]